MPRKSKATSTSPPAAVPAALKPWPADSVERWPLAKIKEYERNARLHTDDQVEQIAESMKRFGVTTPVLVDEDGVLIFGHGRRRAAALLGYAELPVAIARGWTEDEKKAYRIADNQLGLNSEWDLPVLKAEIGELTLSGFTMPLLGFSETQLSALNAGAPTPKDPNAIPIPTKNPFVRAGDIWLLGGHRLAVGDATDPAIWKALFGRERAAMVFTDPPYGVSYEARSGKFEVIDGDEKRRDDLYKMLLGSLREMARYAGPGAAIYVWHASSTREDFAQAMKAAGLVERQYLIWVKPSIVLGHADYLWQHEPCFYASKAEHKPEFYGLRDQSTVWHIAVAAGNETAATVGNGILILDGDGGTLFIQSRAPKNKKLRQLRITKDTSIYLAGSDRRDGTVWEVARDGNHEHPTQKPVQLATRAIENSSRPGEIVTDGFLGSGTTLIGAEITHRRCFGIELDPTYAEVAIRRWETFTNQKAQLEETGETFDQVAKARHRKKRGQDHEAGNPGKPVPGPDAGGDGGKRPVRSRGNARRPEPRGEPAGEPPAVAGDT